MSSEEFLPKPEEPNFKQRIFKYSSSFIAIKCFSSIFDGAILILGIVVRSELLKTHYKLSPNSL